MATIDVKDAAGLTVAVEKPLVPARAAAAASRPVVLSSEDLAVLNAILAAVGDASEATSLEIRDKLIAAPATEAKQTSGNDLLTTIANTLGEVDPAPTVDSIADRLLQIETAVTAAKDILQDIEDQGDAPGAVPVDVETLPADPLGANADAVVAAGAAGSLSAKLRRLTTDLDALLTAVKTGNAEYETVAASQSDQILGATGAVGDFLSHLLIVPATMGAGTVSIKDGNGSAITVFVTGTLSNLAPIPVPLGAVCVNGTTPGWKITTGANVSVIGFGNFT